MNQWLGNITVNGVGAIGALQGTLVRTLPDGTVQTIVGTPNGTFVSGVSTTPNSAGVVMGDMVNLVAPAVVQGVSYASNSAGVVMGRVANVRPTSLPSLSHEHNLICGEVKDFPGIWTCGHHTKVGPDTVYAKFVISDENNEPILTISNPESGKVYWKGPCRTVMTLVNATNTSVNVKLNVVIGGSSHQVFNF